MQIAQRCVLIISTSLLLCLMCVFLYTERENKIIEDWETVQTERFLRKLCYTGECSLESYLLYYNSVVNGLDTLDVRIEEYKKEQDLEGNIYYSRILWEEMKEMLWKNGRYCFDEDSIVLIEVYQYGWITKRMNRKFDRVTGENGNDT